MTTEALRWGGLLAVWSRASRGGYGWVTEIPVRVVDSRNPNRIRIRVIKRDGSVVERFATSRTLRLATEEDAQRFDFSGLHERPVHESEGR